MSCIELFYLILLCKMSLIKAYKPPTFLHCPPGFRLIDYCFPSVSHVSLIVLPGQSCFLPWSHVILQCHPPFPHCPHVSSWLILSSPFLIVLPVILPDLMFFFMFPSLSSLISHCLPGWSWWWSRLNLFLHVLPLFSSLISYWSHCFSPDDDRD